MAQAEGAAVEADRGHVLTQRARVDGEPGGFELFEAFGREQKQRLVRTAVVLAVFLDVTGDAERRHVGFQNRKLRDAAPGNSELENGRQQILV